jgi:hypothetical protein
MYVTESLPAKIWGSRPTGLGVVVVSARAVTCVRQLAVVLTKHIAAVLTKR